MKKIAILALTLMFCAGLGAQAQAAEGSALGGVEIHGFISQGYMISSDNNYLANDSSEGTFQFNEIGINFSKQMGDKLRMGIQLFSRDLGDIGNNEIEVDWALGDYRWKDWLGIRAGILKRPVGLYNETRDMDMLRVPVLLPTSVYYEGLREYWVNNTGLGIYGDIELGAGGTLSYDFQVGMTDGDMDGGLGKIFSNFGGGMVTIDDDWSSDVGYVGALQWQTPLDGLLAKVTYNKMKIDFGYQATTPGGVMSGVSAMDQDHWIFSAEYTWNDLVLAAEYQYSDREMTDSLRNTTSTTKSDAWYISAAYQINNLVSVGASYGESYPDADDRDGQGQVARGLPAHGAWHKDAALSLRFDITDNWIFKVEGHMMDGTAEVFSVDNPDGTEEDWYLGLAKVTYSF